MIGACKVGGLYAFLLIVSNFFIVSIPLAGTVLDCSGNQEQSIVRQAAQEYIRRTGKNPDLIINSTVTISHEANSLQCVARLAIVREGSQFSISYKIERFADGRLVIKVTLPLDGIFDPK